MSSRQSEDMPLKHDILGEHLYAKIDQLHLDLKFSTAKLTGMLLEGGEGNVLRMLEDTNNLREAVTKAESLLSGDTYDVDASDMTDSQQSSACSDPDLCDRLFERVQVLEPQLSAQVTGMLSELDSKTISQLISNDDMLRKAVTKAKLAYMDSTQTTSSQSQTTECNNNTEPVTADPGDHIYDQCFKIFPDHAGQITGMLLEMEAATLQSVISDQNSLNTFIHKAHTALAEHEAAQ